MAHSIAKTYKEAKYPARLSATIPCIFLEVHTLTDEELEC